MSDRSKIDDGGPAFPNAFNHPDVGPHVVAGMSYRDWAAGHALSGVLSIGGQPTPAQAAKAAVECADALIEELKK